MKITVSAHQLSVGYDKKQVVEEIGFSVCAGEILTLIGPNGAGKSTVLKTLSGYLKQISGTILINEMDAGHIRSSDFAKQLAVVLTERIRPDRMTCREVVETGRYPYTGTFGILSEHDKQIVEQAIRTVEAAAFAQQDFSATSDGQKQRILLARAIAQEPDILILDEPTSYLDIHHKIMFFEILRKLVEKQKIAVILSMHELDFAEKISDYVLCIKDGKVQSCGTPDEIFTPDNIMHLYDIPKNLYEKYFG